MRSLFGEEGGRAILIVSDRFNFFYFIFDGLVDRASQIPEASAFDDLRKFKQSPSLTI